MFELAKNNTDELIFQLSENCRVLVSCRKQWGTSLAVGWGVGCHFRYLCRGWHRSNFAWIRYGQEASKSVPKLQEKGMHGRSCNHPVKSSAKDLIFKSKLEFLMLRKPLNWKYYYCFTFSELASLWSQRAQFFNLQDIAFKLSFSVTCLSD